jgi:hypothetical protein
MNTSRKLLFAAAAIAATAAASSAFAQASASASANASVQVIAPITITPTGTLSFGRVVLDGSGTDAVITVDPGATSVPAGNIAHATEVAGGSVSTPSFHVGGEVGQAYNIVLTPAFTGATLSALKTSLASNALTNTVVAGAANDFTVGGTLTIPSGTAAGTLNGTVGVTVTYQ